MSLKLFHARTLIFFLVLLGYVAIGVNYSFLPSLGYYDAQRICIITIQIFAIASIAYAFIYDTKTFQYFYSPLTILLFIGLALTLLSSTISNRNPTYSFTEFFNLIALFMLTFSFALGSKKLTTNAYKTSTTIILTFALSLSLYSFIFIVSYCSALITSLSLDISVMFHGFSNPRFFNQIQTWMLPILILPLLIKLVGSNHFSRYQPLFWGLLCFNIVLLIFSSARGASLSLIVSLIVILILIKPIALRLLLNIVTLTLMAFVLYWLMFVLAPPYFGFEITETINIRTHTADRLDLWLICLNMIKLSPLFGEGPMSFAAIPNELSLSHPHNSLLQLAAEWGLIATGIILFFYIKGFIAFWRLCLDQTVAVERRMYRVSLLWSLLSASIYSLFSGIIVMPMSQLLGTLIIGLMLAEYKSSNALSPQKTIALNAPIRSIFAVGLLIFAGVYAWLVWPQISVRMSDDQSYATDLTNYGPRFWQNGGIPLDNKRLLSINQSKIIP